MAVCLRILISFFLAAIPAVARASKDLVSRQALIEVRGTLGPADWARDLPAGTQLLREAHPFYLVRFPKAPTSAQWLRLRRHPAFRSVTPDRIVRLDQDRDCLDCATAKKNPNLADVEAVGRAIEPPLCEILPRCEGGRPHTLAQFAMGGDLMLKELERLGLSENHTKVMVLDTGFDPNLNLHMSRPVAWVDDFSSRSATAQDLSVGHGSRVASVIGGRGGVGLAPGAELAVTPIAIDEETGATSEATAKMAVLSACRNGYKIINLSYASVNPDINDPSYLQELAKEGCVVLKSAGNQEGQGVGRSDPEDAWIRVGGVRPETNDREGLLVGEYQAPGIDVTVLEPNGAFGCGGLPVALSTGTSLAAPLTAAVLANVRGILARDAKFRGLSGSEQVRLLNRILAASVRGEIVNGLRAVLIAERWASAPPEAKPMSSLENLLARPPHRACAGEGETCREPGLACEKQKTCIHGVRFRIAVCDPLDRDRFRRTALDLITGGQFEVGGVLGQGLADPSMRLRLEQAKIEHRKKEQRAAELRSEIESLEALIRAGEGGALEEDEFSEMSQVLEGDIRHYEEERSAAEQEKARLSEGWLAVFRRSRAAEAQAKADRAEAEIRCLSEWRQGLGSWRDAGRPPRDLRNLYGFLARIQKKHPRCEMKAYLSGETGRLIDSIGEGLDYEGHLKRSEGLRKDAARELELKRRELNRHQRADTEAR